MNKLKVKVRTLNRLIEPGKPDKLFLTLETYAGGNTSSFPIDISQKDYDHALSYFKNAGKECGVAELGTVLVSHTYKFD